MSSAVMCSMSSRQTLVSSQNVFFCHTCRNCGRYGLSAPWMAVMRAGEPEAKLTVNFVKMRKNKSGGLWVNE